MKNVLKWLKEQLPGIIITSIIGWVITVLSIDETNPQFVVDGVRSTIINRENLSDQPVRIVKIDGEEVTKDIISATFYFYNAGSKAIVGKE